MRSDSECLDDLLAAIAGLEALTAERDERQDFNVFEVLGVVNAEIRHSNTIAWLMDPNGEHGLGGWVLSSLIEHAGGTSPADMGDFSIRREADRIDILAESRENRIVLAIENKVWSGEHDDQLARYRRIVEEKHPGWEHLFLYLTPNDDSPESDEDAAVWTTLGYGDLAEIVEQALKKAGPSDKAKILIGDYLECIRRHIVGDEELSERCVEIYAQHKRAIDLIMANLPETAKTVHDRAREWAREIEGAYVVEKCSGGSSYVRFRTDALDEFFPPLDITDSWKQNSFWFYEIVTKKTGDGLGCTLNIQLCFNHPRKSDLHDGRLETAMRFIEAFADGDEGTFYITSYSGFISKSARFAAGSFELPDVVDVCERLWEDFQRREACAIEEVFG